MMNYIIWKSDNENELLIEVFNSCDVLDIQKQFVTNGYIITECFDTSDSSFIRCYKTSYKANEY